MIAVYLLLSTLALRLAAAQIPVCASTTTIKPVGQVTATCTQLTYATRTTVLSVTAPASTGFTTTATTVFSPTAVTCLSSATTYKATLSLLPLPSLPPRQPRNLKVRENAPKVTGAPQLPIPFPCPNLPPALPFPPVVPSGPCVAVEGPYTVTSTTSTATIAVTSISLIPAAPTTVTFTKTSVLPTPSAYSGLKYYQYTNTYHYPDKFGQGTTAGYGGGGYETADWSNNTNYETSNLTHNADFSTPNWPSYDNLNCQLPGQPTPRNCEHWTVVYQGFLFAQETGDYTFTPSQPTDNELLIWGGQKAYSSFDNANSDIVIGYVATPDNKPITGKFSLVEGEFFPVTIIFVNGFGPALQELGITSPNGTKYPTVDFFVPPCDRGLFIP